jgi:NAD(P)-dependent dehydrogenase (short-subunit alcohol dehydrogenase family)
MMTNPFSLESKNIVISGASSGIGRQCAISCSNMGANVILLGRRLEELNKTLLLCRNNVNRAFQIDLAQFHEIEPIISLAVQQTGLIHGFIHCAGVQLTSPLNAMNSKKISDLFNINLFAGIEIIRILSKPKYCNSSGASFILISSITAFAGKPGIVAYAASKGALNSAANSLAIELAHRRIRVNSVCPGLIKTEMLENLTNDIGEEGINNLSKDYPLGIGNPEDVANACIFLLSDAAKWVTGSHLVVDGGFLAK